MNLYTQAARAVVTGYVVAFVVLVDAGALAFALAFVVVWQWMARRGVLGASATEPAPPAVHEVVADAARRTGQLPVARVDVATAATSALLYVEPPARSPRRALVSPPLLGWPLAEVHALAVRVLHDDPVVTRLDEFVQLRLRYALFFAALAAAAAGTRPAAVTVPALVAAVAASALVNVLEDRASLANDVAAARLLDDPEQLAAAYVRLGVARATERARRFSGRALGWYYRLDWALRPVRSMPAERRAGALRAAFRATRGGQ